MALPLREYYPISRASELLGCDTGDLLHWAEIGAINLYIPFDSGRGYVHFCNDSDGLKEEYIDKFYISDAVSYVSSIFNGEDEVSVEFFNKKPPLEKILPCGFSGFWALPRQAFGCGQLFEFTPSLFDLWLSANKKMFILFDADEYISIDHHSLYLMKHDFKIISGCKDNRELPNYFNEGKEEIKLGENTAESHPTQERHSKNRLDVVMAAINFKEKHQDTFNSECIKNDGTYNFTEWARQVLDRPTLFPNCEIKIKSIDTVQSYISAIFKAPDERR